MPMLAIPAIISAVSAWKGAKSAKKAGQQISGAATKQAGETRATGAKVTGRMEDMYKTGVEGLQPYAQAGAEGLTSLKDFLSVGGGAQPFKFDPATAAEDPSFQFQVDNMLRAAQNSAGGRLFAGGTTKRIMGEANQLAATQYQDRFNRALAEYNTKNDVYSRLMGLTGLGYNASGQMAGLGANFATAAGGADMSIQDEINRLLMEGTGAEASSTMAQGNAWQQALGGISNMATSQMSFNRMRDLLGMQGGGGVSVVPPAPGGAPIIPSDLFTAPIGR